MRGVAPGAQAGVDEEDQVRLYIYIYIYMIIIKLVWMRRTRYASAIDHEKPYESRLN